MKLRALSLALAALALSPAQAATPPGLEGRDDVTAVEADDPEMDAAIAEAQRSLPQFLAMLADPPARASDIAFKFPLGGWEHIWVTEVALQGDKLVGRLGNDPVQEGHRFGDVVRVPLGEVSDWSWRGADGVMRGHHTTRVLLGRMEPAQAAEIRAALGWAN